MTDLPTRIEALAERAEAAHESAHPLENHDDYCAAFNMMRACYRAQKLLAEAEVICGGVEAHPKRAVLVMQAEALVKEAEGT